MKISKIEISMVRVMRITLRRGLEVWFLEVLKMVKDCLMAGGMIIKVM